MKDQHNTDMFVVDAIESNHSSTHFWDWPEGTVTANIPAFFRLRFEHRPEKEEVAARLAAFMREHNL